MRPLASKPAAGLQPSGTVSLSAADAASRAIANSTCLCWATQVPVIYRPPRAGKAHWSLRDFTDSVSFHYTKASPSNLIFREENDCFSFVLLRHFLLTWVIKLQKLSTQLFPVYSQRPPQLCEVQDVCRGEWVFIRFSPR